MISYTTLPISVVQEHNSVTLCTDDAQYLGKTCRHKNNDVEFLIV